MAALLVTDAIVRKFRIIDSAIKDRIKYSLV